jgi:hypothetical protein
VDLVGEMDAARLVLEPEGHWTVVLSRVPRFAPPLDAASLTQALWRVMR